MHSDGAARDLDVIDLDDIDLDVSLCQAGLPQ